MNGEHNTDIARLKLVRGNVLCQYDDVMLGNWLIHEVDLRVDLDTR